MNSYGTLYLLPVALGESNLEDILPKRNLDIVKSLTYFIAENPKEARAFIKQCAYAEISKADLSLINKHTNKSELNSFLEPLLKGENIGLMSDAGCPGVADPGAEVVKLAHEKGIKVVPLVGPSSILLSIMASGFNGQSFAFNGYLPIDKQERSIRAKELEMLCAKYKQAQFFIETPFRNQSFFEDLLKILKPTTQLLVATHLTLSDETITVKTVANWTKAKLPDFVKKPTVFGIYV